MQLPPIQGIFDRQDFFIYVACDHRYFTDFGPSFINSVRANTDHDIHLHLFNPQPDQISYCQRHGVGVTWEHVHQPAFVTAAQRWIIAPEHEPDKSQYERTQNAMTKGRDSGLAERMQKTYYACARFIRLSEIYLGQRLLAVDIDAIVRHGLPDLSADRDFYIHHIDGKKSRYLAGGIWLNGTNSCKSFLTEYAVKLRGYFERDHVYWGLDQDLLDLVVPSYNHGQLPIEYIDWNMRPTSHIWTAKGTRKSLSVFINEQQKYIV
jgi:hypothetical protein